MHSRARFAQVLADALRADFAGIAPDAHGAHATLSTGLSGPRKLDVTHATRARGLELGISIKTLRDDAAEVRDVCDVLLEEAQDLHERQPHAVLVAYVLASGGLASDAVRIAADALAQCAGRVSVDADHVRFEHVFLALDDRGHARFVEVTREPVCTRELTLAETCDVVRATHRRRNERRLR